MSIVRNNHKQNESEIPIIFDYENIGRVMDE